ncbi:MAG TPA: cyclic nucleotide-binding domain-containing protein [Burkholderiales bacterium]
MTAAPAASRLYKPAVALDFFKSGGKPERVAAGGVIFAEGKRGLLFGDKMYLLISGEVELQAKKKPIATLKAGEIFGELAAIDGAPRTASAVAKTPCKLIGLDEKQFYAALRKKPAFALMVMSVMIGRLRDTITRLAAAGDMSEKEASKESVTFKPKMLADLVRGLADDPPVFFLQGKQIMQAGQTGLRMYAIVEGKVTVTIGGRVVERLGPGGVFGEAALVDQSTRLASAVAETDCSLLAISRQAFMALVKVSPQFADAILASLAERMRFLTGRLQ